MYLESIRDMNDGERRVLRGMLSTAAPVSGRSTVKGILVGLGGLALVVLCGAGLIALKPNAVVGGLAGGFLFVVGIVCLYAVLAQISSFFRWRNIFRQSQRDTVPAIRKVLEEGKVHAKRIIASEVIEIAEFEDEGSGYIFDIGESQSLLLKGQQYLPAQETMPWPASEFELVRSPDGSLWIGLFSAGKPLPPVRSVSTSDCRGDFLWSEQETVLQGNPETVLQSLLKTAQPTDRSDAKSSPDRRKT